MANKKLYIIDGHSHIYAAYYAPMRPLTSPAGEPTKAAYIFTTAILGVLENDKPDMLVVAMDSKKATFRQEIYKEYKAHRPEMPDDMPGQIRRIEQILSALKVPVLRVEGYEADDIIGTVARNAAGKGTDVYICSKDKDLLQLVNDHVFVYDISKGEKTDRTKMLEKKKVPPERFVDCLALQGDASDNIPGVPDVGPKTAINWIQKYGSLENLYENADQIGGKRGSSLRESKEQAFLSRQLVTIERNVPIDIDFDSYKVERPDFNKLKEIFTELGFNRQLNQLGISSDNQRGKSQKKKSDGPQTRKDVEHDYELIDSQEKFEQFAKQLEKQDIFAIDTETDSLNAMRAKLVGLSFSWEPHKAFYLPVRGPLGSKYLDVKKVIGQLAPILANENVKKIGQNLKYDMLVLTNADMPLKGTCFDTMVASYCLDPLAGASMDKMAIDYLDYECMPISTLIGKGKNQLTFDMVETTIACEYAAEDADITYQLYEYLSMRLDNQPALKKLFEQLEMPLVEVLAQMEYNGVSLDTNLLRKMGGEIDAELKSLQDRIYELAGRVFNIDSPKQLAEVLFDDLGLQSLRSGKTGRSTSAAVLDRLSGEHQIVDLILQYRQLSKLQNTYINKLGTLIHPVTGKVHASFNQTVTATGRLSSSDPNLQNIPIRTELGKKIRGAFVAEKENYYILSADYSQIELRLLAHFSKDPALLKAFNQDQDIHRFVASQIFDVVPENVTSQMRSKCKAVNFGIIYGQGPFGLSRTIGIPHSEAKQFIEDYYKRYGSIREFMDSIIESAKKNGYVETMMGRRRKIKNLKSSHSGRKTQAQRLAVNTLIQGSAADLIKQAMVNIHRKIKTRYPQVKMILQIHDELVFEVPADEFERHIDWIRSEMTQAIKLDVPLKVDINYGPSWLSDK